MLDAEYPSREMSSLLRQTPRHDATYFRLKKNAFSGNHQSNGEEFHPIPRKDRWSRVASSPSPGQIAAAAALRVPGEPVHGG